MSLRVVSSSDHVVGVEDLALDTTTGVVYLSAYDRRAVDRQVRSGARTTTQGGIYALASPTAWPQDTTQVRVTDLTREFKQDADFHPHGISLWQVDGRAMVLFAVNRAYVLRHGKRVLRPRVEIFDVDGSRLVHRATVADPLLCHPNDLVAVGPSQFLITNDHGSCAGLSFRLEDALGLARSFVSYYDGTRFRTVVERVEFANGIAVDPPGGTAGARRLYVAATRGPGLLVYDLMPLLAGTPASRPREIIPLGSGVDNIEWGEDGRLYYAAHPSLIRYALYRRDLRSISPSRLGRLDSTVLAGDFQIQALYSGDGRLLSGATVATVVGGHLLAGSAYADHMMICEL